MQRSVYLGAVAVLWMVALAADVAAQTVISTDGDVAAQGFIGDGSQVTSVDADLLDSMDSSAFAQDSDLQNVETMLAALQTQVDALGVALIPRTGQTTCYAANGDVVACGTGIGQGQDGDLQLGVTWPNPRFTVNEVAAGVPDGTVTDNLTSLIWLRDANCSGTEMTWADALAEAEALFDGCTDCGGFNNDCGLADGSLAGEWRLPNVRELQSLVYYGATNPAVPDTSGTGQWSEGDPFTGLQLAEYWSSTTEASAVAYFAWKVSALNSTVGTRDKSSMLRVWLVRGGQ